MEFETQGTRIGCGSMAKRGVHNARGKGLDLSYLIWLSDHQPIPFSLALPAGLRVSGNRAGLRLEGPTPGGRILSGNPRLG